MLIHQIADEIRRARGASRPFALLIGGDQLCLRSQPSDVGRVVRSPESINQCERTRELRIVFNHNQSCVHQTVSASISSYSAWVPKNRTAITPASYWTAATSR